MRVSGVGLQAATSVLDGAEMLLGAGGDFGDVGQQAIGIRTINTSNLLNGV